MPEPTQLANEARSTLAKALEALQSSPDVPDALLDMAEPIAKTMGLLLRIERSEGRDLDGVDQALESVRGALDKLQTASDMHPAADDAMEHVAASLSKLFALSKAKKAAGAQPVTAAPKVAQAAAAGQATVAAEPAPQARSGSGGTTQPSIQEQPSIQQASVQQASIQQASVQQASAQQPGEAPQFTSRGTVRIERPDIDAARAAQPAALGQTLPVAERPAFPEPARQRPSAPPFGGAAPREAPARAPAPAGGRPIDVELGAHSSSNFYKGLSGNDVIDHGGIFVQTYTLPKIGDNVLLHIHLPGDLDFDASAVVQWTRETRSGESEPGFGARFTQISDEGRQLVYRYVRNREPIFYDDF